MYAKNREDRFNDERQATVDLADVSLAGRKYYGGNMGVPIQDRNPGSAPH
jgi:hypothetical protein